MSIVITPIPSTIELAEPSFTLGTTNTAGAAVTAVSSNSTLLTFDGTAYETIASGGSGALGSATVGSRRDHGHPVNAFGDVSGPGSSTDNEIARQSGTGGKTLQSYTSLAPTISDDGAVLWPGQPLVHAYVNSIIDDVTGAGTPYTVLFNAELADHTGAWNTGTGTFTAPIQGAYLVNVDIFLSTLVAAMTSAANQIITSNRTHWIYQGAYGRADADGSLQELYSIIVDMDADDTMTFVINIKNGSGDTADLVGSSSGIYSQIGIWLLG